jgi:hypothetical protein
MSKEDRDVILQAAAKALAWDLFATAGCGQLRQRISTELFDRKLRSAVRQWRTTHKNLNIRKEPDR